MLPGSIGGYPDLFGPPDGWEAWEKRALSVLDYKVEMPNAQGERCACGDMQFLPGKAIGIRNKSKHTISMCMIYGG